MAPHLRRLSPRCLFNVVFALARWGDRVCGGPGGAVFLASLSGEAPRLFAALEPSQLVVATWSLHTLGYRPPAEVLEAFRSAVAAVDLRFSDEEAGAMLGALEAMGADLSDYPSLLLLRLKRLAKRQREGGGEGGWGGEGQGGAVPPPQVPPRPPDMLEVWDE
jgi:hypothetical protein